MAIAKEKYRNEKKYVISALEAKWAINMLSNWMVKDENSDSTGQYKVRSLYFDDIEKTAYYEKLEGFYFRKKYRARIYFKADQDEPSAIKLECKRRTGHKITKKANVISGDEFKKITTYDLCVKEPQEGILDDFYTDSTNMKLSPGIIVDYDRVALVDKFYNFRITFDSNLSAGWQLNDFFSKNLLTVPVFDKNEVVLEIKYKDVVPEHITSILKNTRMHEQSFSKFFICMNNYYGQITKELL